MEYMREIYHAVDKAFGGKDPGLFYELGRHGVEVSIKGFLRFLARNLMSVEQLLKRTNAFWKNYHRGGEIQTSRVSKKGNRRILNVTIKGFNIARHACIELSGYIECLTRKAGAKDVKVAEKACIHKGDDVCSWIISWEE
ncbi:hypothetical protein GF359_00005 [candidate division WOR-3 bacterium]|uniref:4-vinyl reductase 4VR domain-containing protein n=1 Tax=candidate division WOR-3 bacterium TaxID=2052148 RepID=A0A9D5K7B3_UNCW3|nr:hypothetical protein [candidate division WOR-3 bacterium]MBD3363577.1 hypothetical protein [candidate division WOR-3 bacterium]